MITIKKVLSLIAIAIMIAIVSVACKKKPTDAGNISASIESSQETPAPTTKPEENKSGSKSDIVGTWNGKYVQFWIDDAGNLNFDNVDTEGLWGYNSSYAGYKGKIADTFQYPYSITLSFTPPAEWKVVGEKTRTGKFVFTSPTSGYFTGGIVQKVVYGPYGWTTITPAEGSVTKQK